MNSVTSSDSKEIEVTVDVELGEEATETMRLFAGTWKIVWVVSLESMQAFLTEQQHPHASRLTRHAQGREFEFELTDDNMWVESELDDLSVFFERPMGVRVNGPAERRPGPGGSRDVMRRVAFADDKLLVTEDVLDQDNGRVEQVLELVDENTLHRTFTNLATRTRFVFVYSRSGAENHHRNVALHAEIDSSTDRTFRKAMAALPAAAFIPCWLFAMIKNQIWKKVFVEFWPMTAAMVLGSFIAGSTPLGGGVVGFPVSVLALGFDASQGRDFSAMIQSVGMTSASYLIIYLKPQMVHAKLVAFSIFFGVVGCVFGFVVPLREFVVNLTLTTYLVAFAIVYCYKNEVIEQYAIPIAPTAADRQKKLAKSAGSPHPADADGFPNEEPAAMHPERLALIRDSMLAFSALIGGFVTAKLGSGSDSMCYIFASFGWNSLVPSDQRLSESTMTASTVVIMATMSVVVVGLRMATGDITPDVVMCWAAAAPVVSLGAPIGSLVLGPAAEIMLRRFFYFIAFVQFLLFAIIVIRTNVPGWSVISAVIVLTTISILAHYFLRFQPHTGDRIKRAVSLPAWFTSERGRTDPPPKPAPSDDDDDNAVADTTA